VLGCLYYDVRDGDIVKCAGESYPNEWGRSVP